MKNPDTEKSAGASRAASTATLNSKVDATDHAQTASGNSGDGDPPRRPDIGELGYSSPSQVFWACLALAMGRSICHLDEVGEAQGWRLSDIVYRLRHKFGWPVATDYIGSNRVGYYRLADGCDVLALDYPKSAQRVPGIIKKMRREAGNGEA